MLRLSTSCALEVRRAQVQGLRAMQAEARERVKECAIYTLLLYADSLYGHLLRLHPRIRPTSSSNRGKVRVDE